MSKVAMELTIVSAEAELFSGEVQSLIVTGASGEIGVHPGHTALLTAVKPGYIKFVLDSGEEQVYYISGGFLEVQPTKATLLSNTAARADELDEASAQTAKEQAEASLSDQTEGMDYTRAMAELAEASAQLRAIQMLRKKH